MAETGKGDSKGRGAKSRQGANTEAGDTSGAYIYALSDPDTAEIRYIGKANEPAKRLKGHIRDAARRDTPVYRWIRKLQGGGKTPCMTVLEFAADWKEAETRLITQYRLTHRLLNVAEGGDQPYCSYEVRAENGRKAAKARVADPEKAKLYRGKQLLAMALKRGHVSETTKEKMREAAKRMPNVFGEWALI